MILLVFMIILWVGLINKSYVNKMRFRPGEVVLIFANIGTGKSTLFAKLAKEEQKRIDKGKSKYKGIVSNVMIKGVTYCPNLRALLKKGMFVNYLVLGDEASVEWNNRQMNMSMLEIEEVKLIRKYDCSLVLASQNYQDTDITLRRLFTKLYLLRSVGNVTIIKAVRKFITINEESQDFVDGYEFKNWFLNNQYIYRPKYYHLFDSYFRPDHIPILDVENNLIRYSDGRSEPIREGHEFIPIESAKKMSWWEKKKCNRNVQVLLDSGIFKLVRGRLVKAPVVPAIENIPTSPKEKDFTQVLSEMRNTQ